MSHIKDQSTGLSNLNNGSQLIHIKHNISDLQYKIWYLLLYMVFYGNTSQEEKPYLHFVIRRSKIDELLGYELSTKKLTQALKALRSTSINLDYFCENSDQKTPNMGFVSEYRVTSKKISFSLPNYIQRLLDQGEAEPLFLLLSWNVLISFKSRYSTIIYKFCKYYADNGKTIYLEVDQFRDYLGLENNEHMRISNLTTNCIKYPISEINESNETDISIEVVYKKSGAKIIGLCFMIKKKLSSY